MALRRLFACSLSLASRPPRGRRYEEKGFSRKEAEGIISVMAGHKEFFIDHMMVQELGLLPPDPAESAWKSGLVMFLAFLAFGLVPLLSYLAFSTINFKTNRETSLFAIACVLTAVALFILGATKSKFSQQAWWKSGLWVLLNGTLAAGAAYLVGYVLEKIVGETTCPGANDTSTTAP